jgi:hypothetical protein
MNRTMVKLFAASSALISGTALAQFDQGDIIIRVHNGRLQTGSALGAEPDFSTRVFTSVTDEFGLVSEPGFDALPSDLNLPAGSSLGFVFTGATRVWNGSSFAASPGSSVRVRYATLDASSPASDVTSPGFLIPVDPSTDFHHHPSYRVNAPLGAVYLQRFALVTDAPGVAPSRDYWIIFDTGAPNDALAALAWSQSHLLCRADVAGVGGSVGGDGQLSVDDVIVYLGAFFRGDTGIADLTNLGGAGGPDGTITADDLIAFLSAFFTGCAG